MGDSGAQDGARPGGQRPRPQHRFNKPKFQQDRGTKRHGGGGHGAAGGIGGEGPANKKRRVKLERAKSKPAFDLVARAKAIWGSFRTKRLDKAERARLSEELFGLIKGRLHQIAVKHDAARVVQCALLHGSPAQREAYTTELLEHMLELSKSQYAYFIVLRLLDVTAGQAAERRRILRAFSGRVHTLATHAVGAKVLEGIFSTYPKQDTQALRAELYGRETQLLLAGAVGGGADPLEKGRDLKAVLSELPERRDKVLAGVLGVLQRMLSKGLVGTPFVQELLWEYVTNAGPQAVRELVPSLMDYLLLLTGTRPGCKVLSECAAYGTPKDRKKMLKALKGYVVPTLLHKDAYLFILRLTDVVDDTVAVAKALWQELLERDATEATMLRFATHVKASKVLLSLLAPEGKRPSFLTKEELELLRPAFVPASAPAPDEEQGGEAEGAAPAPAAPAPSGGGEEPAMVPTSKKAPEVRRQELLAPLKGALLQLGRTHARELLCSAEGSFVLYEVATRWRDPVLLEAVAVAAAADGVPEEEQEQEEGEEEGEAMAVQEEKETGAGTEEAEMDVEGAEGPPKGEDEKQQPRQAQQPAAAAEEEEAVGPLREHRIAYRTMKRLLLFEAAAPKGQGQEAPDPLFAEALSRQVKGEWLRWLGSMRGGFVVEALVKVPRVGPEVLTELRQHQRELEELAASNLKGAAAVLETMKQQRQGRAPPRKANKGAAGKCGGGGAKAAAAGGAKKGKKK